MQERRSDRYRRGRKGQKGVDSAPVQETPYALPGMSDGSDADLSPAQDVSVSQSESSTRGAKAGKVWLGVLVVAVACLGVIAVAAAQSMQEPPHPTLNISETAQPTATPTVSASSEPSEEAVETPEPEPTPKVMIPEMAELYAQNNDLAGWIKIDGTIIDYPVMYTPSDGEFYLYRTFEKEEDPTKQGCVFIDEHCMIDPRGTNLLLHGHNMRKGTMFHSLIEYEDIDFYREHPTIKFTTLYDQEEYEIVYAFRSRVYDQADDVFKYYKFYQADTQEEFDGFVNGCRGLALYDTGIEPVFGDEFLTLNTCEYSVENGRMVIVARKKRDDGALGAAMGPAPEATVYSRVVAPGAERVESSDQLSEEITVYGEISA